MVLKCRSVWWVVVAKRARCPRPQERSTRDPRRSSPTACQTPCSQHEPGIRTTIAHIPREMHSPETRRVLGVLGALILCRSACSASTTRRSPGRPAHVPVRLSISPRPRPCHRLLVLRGSSLTALMTRTCLWSWFHGPPSASHGSPPRPLRDKTGRVGERKRALVVCCTTCIVVAGLVLYALRKRTHVAVRGVSPATHIADQGSYATWLSSSSPIYINPLLPLWFAQSDIHLIVITSWTLHLGAVALPALSTSAYLSDCILILYLASPRFASLSPPDCVARL